MNVLLEYHFVFDDNQFGFVKEGGCSKAIYAVKSCFDYFIERGSDVFFASLDTAKTFYFLLSCMIEKGFPLQLVRIFESWFGNLRSSVLWNYMSHRPYLILNLMFCKVVYYRHKVL